MSFQILLHEYHYQCFLFSFLSILVCFSPTQSMYRSIIYKLCSSKIYLNAVVLLIFMGINFSFFGVFIKFTANYTSTNVVFFVVFSLISRIGSSTKSTKICAQWIMIKFQYTNVSIQKRILYENFRPTLSLDRLVFFQHCSIFLTHFKMWAKLIRMQFMRYVSLVNQNFRVNFAAIFRINVVYTCICWYLHLNFFY